MDTWDPRAVLNACATGPWNGRAWRFHRRKYPATDPGGSLHVTGRFNHGRDHFPEDDVWPALYLSLGPDVCMGEVFRHVTPATLARLNDYRLSEVVMRLECVADCRDCTFLGIPVDALLHDTDFAVGHALAEAAIERNVEALLVPSATRLGDNLIAFPLTYRATSVSDTISHRDPSLYVPRP